MNIFVTNCQHHNWNACVTTSLFGLKEGRSLPPLENGDLILMRLTGTSENGVKALWYFESAIEVDSKVKVPWDDAKYSWILKCKQIITLPNFFKEGFSGVGSHSTKIPNFPASRIQPSIIHLKKFEAQAYLENIIKEFDNYLHKKFDYKGNEKYIDDFLKNVLTNLENEEPNIQKSYTHTNSTNDFKISEMIHSVEETKNDSEIPWNENSYGTVGERIDLPILNYSPINEMGVILLFGYYLQDLGFSHLEEIRTSFPDAIGMRSIGSGRYKRVRIEFEFRSSSFKRHNHPINGCDVIVCWIHDWVDCPLQVIELRKELNQTS
jgi:hypothetical protein